MSLKPLSEVPWNAESDSVIFIKIIRYFAGVPPFSKIGQIFSGL